MSSLADYQQEWRLKLENKEKLGEELLEESKKKEKQLLSRAENYLFLDIETGCDYNDTVKEIRLNKIRKEIEKEQYQWRFDWKPETNETKKEEFELQKPDKIRRQLEALNNLDATSPFYNRIVIMGYESTNMSTQQLVETLYPEKDMILTLSKDIEMTGSTIVTFSQFDIHTIRLKAAKHGILFNPRIIDISSFASYWPMTGRKELVSQDILAGILGVKPNKYALKVYPEEIGELFDNIKSVGLTEEWKAKLDLYLKYNAEDVRVLREIFFKLKQANIIW